MSNEIEEKVSNQSEQRSSVLNTLFNNNSKLYPILNVFNASQPEKTIKPFTVLINDQLSHMKESMLASLIAYQNELSAQYDDYISQIQIFLSNQEEKLYSIYQKNQQSNDISSFFSYVERNIFSKFNELIELHSIIQMAIEKNINLMKEFLDKQDLINEKKPIESFLQKESNSIFSSWLLAQFNFEKINISHLLYNNPGLFNYCKKFICLKAEKNSKTIDIRKNSSSSFNYENAFIKNNATFLEKIRIYNINTDDLIKYYPREKRDVKRFPTNINYISISKSDFKEYDWGIAFNDSNTYLPIQCCVFKKVIVNPSFIKAFSFLPQLTRIYIKKCNLNDRNFDNLLDILRQNDKIMNTLEVLSLPGNHFTYIKVVFSSTIVKKKSGFNALSEIDFEGNNIYDFASENFNYLPQLKVLNLSHNNISSFTLHYLIQEKNKMNKCLLLLAGNICVINNKIHNSDYYNYLVDLLPAFDHPLKSMSLSLLFNRFTAEKAINLSLSPYANIYLKRLNLSYCSLNTDTLLQLLRKNNCLMSLTHLNLNNNVIDITFLDEYNKDSTIQAHKLKKIDLGSNAIRLSKDVDIWIIQDFFDINPNLKLMKIQDNQLERDLMNQYKDKPIEETSETSNKFNNFAYFMITAKRKLVMKSQYGNSINNDHLKKFILFKNKNN